MADDDWEENPFENRPTGKKQAKRISKEDADARKDSFAASIEREPPPPGAPTQTAVPDEENPFETRSETPLAPVGEDEVNPFENVPSDAGYGYREDEEYLGYDEFDKSKLSFVSGIGFVSLGFIIYFFVVVPAVPHLLMFSAVAIILSTLVAFFYLFDDLKFRTARLTERGARFLSGIFFMILVIMFIIALMTYWPDIGNLDYTSPIVLIVVMVLTNASVALFLYSMLWEE